MNGAHLCAPFFNFICIFDRNPWKYEEINIFAHFADANQLQ